MNDKERKKVIVLAANGKTIAAIMGETGLKEAEIRKICKDVNIRIERHCKPVKDADKKQILELWAEGYSTSFIVRTTGFGRSTINRYIAENKKRCDHEENTEQQMQLPLCNEIKEIPLEAMRMIRDALDIMIEARLS